MVAMELPIICCKMEMIDTSENFAFEITNFVIGGVIEIRVQRSIVLPDWKYCIEPLTCDIEEIAGGAVVGVEDLGGAFDVVGAVFGVLL